MQQASSRATSAQGPYSDMQALLQLRGAAANLRIAAPYRLNSALGGLRRSSARGRGMEFEEARPYAAGDDVRSIDWRVTARTGSVHTKVFREERERPVHLLVDQRRSMFFGSRCTLKSVQAVHAAAILSWATVAGGDRLGGMVLGEREHHELRPRRSQRSVIELLRLCHEFNHRLGIADARSEEPSTRLAEALTSLRRVVRPGSLVLLISDFPDCDASAARQLHLLARHAEVIAVSIHDPLERVLPAQGLASVSDGRTRRLLDTDNPQLRARHSDNFQARQQALLECMTGIGASVLALATDEDAFEVLGRFFRERKRR
jgi:uncharacterized protein (DUF58 family)